MRPQAQLLPLPSPQAHHGHLVYSVTPVITVTQANPLSADEAPMDGEP